jgi:phenylpropionate dioxygenase-like ring-hydroxylating dioxygenase large terminal subunit
MATLTTAANGKRWATKYPEIGTGPVPTEPYISSDYFQRERERLFRRAWLYVGRVEDVAQAGDYFVKEIEVCDASILVVRGRDGVVRGFHNICTHRCNKLVWDPCGTSRSFSCRFHGWTFKPDGRLTGVPDEGQFYDLKKSELGLRPVPLDSWKGFIFVNLDQNPKESLAEYLGQLKNELIGQYPFDRPTDCWSWKVDLQCNWKVTLDAFSEAYHAPFVHRQTVKSVVTDRGNPLAHPLAIRIYGRHYMYSIPGNPYHKPGPIAQLAYRYAPLMTRFRDVEIMKRLPPGVNPTGSDKWGFDTYHIFPNILVSMFGEWWHIHHFQPLGVDRTRWELRVFFPKAENAGQRFTQEYTKCLLQDNMLEDLSTVEGSQRGMASRVVTHFTLQDQEILIRHNQKIVEEFVNAQ